MTTGYKNNLPQTVLDLYEVHEAHHASAILARDFPTEYGEVCTALSNFRIKQSMVMSPGGNESEIPKAFAQLLRPSWTVEKLEANMVVNNVPISSASHYIDFVKGRVALDFEWNSKDQTFDRDLYAFRAFFEFDRISVGILVTRSEELHVYFKSLGSYTDKHGTVRKYSDKYGASTTQMGKLLPRVRANRHGGCPLLIFGITEKVIDKSS